MTDDDLEKRQDRLWEMEEVRGGDTDIDDTADTTDTESTAGTADTAVPADMEDAAEPAATAETADTGESTDTEGLAHKPDMEDTADRAGTEDVGDVADTDATAGTADAEMAALSDDASVHDLYQVAEQQGLTVDDLHNVNVYLFEQVHDEMKALLAEVNYRAMTQRGNEVERNKEFFNAIYRVAARHEDEVLDELGLDP